MRIAVQGITATLSLLLVACGGGNGNGSAGGASPTAVSPTSPASTDQPNGTTGSSSTATPQTVTSLKLESTLGAEQVNVPFTVGQVFAPGDLTRTAGMAGKLAGSDATLPLQLDIMATHADGSVRHAIVSGVLPKLSAGQSQTISLVKNMTAAAPQAANTPQDLMNHGFTTSVSVTLGGQVYTASPDAALRAGQVSTWLSGPVANEWLVAVPLKTAQGDAHPHLMARFAIRSYAGLRKARVDVILENDWAYEAGPQNFTYDVAISVGGQAAYTQAALTHFHHARWRKTLWWGTAPQWHARHDSAYLIATNAVPGYDTTLTISPTALGVLNTRWAAAATGPMAPGIVTTYMPTTGGRPDIGPLPQWAAMYLLSMDKGIKDITLGVGDLAGSWPVHYRDKATDRPVSLQDYPYMTLLGNPGDTYNPVTRKSEAFPACGGDCTTAPYNYSPDSAHQPSMAYVPYLVTGDHYYLEELQFWANWNMLRSNPGYRGQGKGWVTPDQVRGQAWSLRTLGQVAYVTPDAHPMKRYFLDRIKDNLDRYNAVFTNGNPNALGVIDGSAGAPPSAYTTPSGPSTGLAPWQDDFFTWSTGYLAELGFEQARPLLAWKSRFPVGRMTAPGFCWIDATTYALAVRPSSSLPYYTTLAEAYQATMRKADGSTLTNSTGTPYLSLPCGSQAQADWRTQADLDAGTHAPAWVAGQMVGYADSTEGYPANFQPALAVAAKSGIADAERAWTLFASRARKPDYTQAPQWAVVPRK